MAQLTLWPWIPLIIWYRVPQSDLKMMLAILCSRPQMLWSLFFGMRERPERDARVIVQFLSHVLLRCNLKDRYEILALLMPFLI